MEKLKQNHVRRGIRKYPRNYKWGILFISPWLLGFFGLQLYPLLQSLYYSFTDFSILSDGKWIGTQNYADLFTDSRVGKSYVFTFKYALAGTILVNVLSLIMAVGLNSKIRCKSALRGIYFVPNILGGLVIGYIFSFIFTYILPTVGNVFHIGFLQNSILSPCCNLQYGNRTALV